MSTTASASGSAPPRYSTDCHPQRESITDAASPAMSAPPPIPQKIIDTSTAWRRLGAYSVARATTFGIAPPRPRPVRNLKTTSSFSDVARAVNNEKTPNTIVEPTIAQRLPQRSAIGPDAIDATMSPTRPAARTGPNVLSGT